MNPLDTHLPNRDNAAGGDGMKSFQVDMPDKLAEELDGLVRDGWFHSEAEAVRAAVQEFLRHHRSELMENAHREDIAWALRQKGRSA